MVIFSVMLLFLLRGLSRERLLLLFSGLLVLLLLLLWGTVRLWVGGFDVEVGGGTVERKGSDEDEDEDEETFWFGVEEEVEGVERTGRKWVSRDTRRMNKFSAEGGGAVKLYIAIFCRRVQSRRRESLQEEVKKIIVKRVCRKSHDSTILKSLIFWYHFSSSSRLRSRSISRSSRIRRRSCVLANSSLKQQKSIQKTRTSERRKSHRTYLNALIMKFFSSRICTLDVMNWWVIWEVGGNSETDEEDSTLWRFERGDSDSEKWVAVRSEVSAPTARKSSKFSELSFWMSSIRFCEWSDWDENSEDVVKRDPKKRKVRWKSKQNQTKKHIMRVPDSEEWTW